MATIDRETQNRWILGEQLRGVAFHMRQHVRVTHGVHSGVRGVLISIYELGPDPLYHLEAKSGDCEVRQSELTQDD
jgi:hypothetical protein